MRGKRWCCIWCDVDLAPTQLLQLLSTDYKFAVSFSILIIVLLFMPTGIFKGK